ncbi:MAG: glycosyltransferase family 2 protein [Tardiphaga sp.]
MRSGEGGEFSTLLPSTPQQSQSVDGACPCISVAIPTFRRPDMIRRALDSVLLQRFSDWEVVVSDDEGPHSASWKIVEEYARAEPRIRIVENRRGRGQVENTNNAMLACRGSWIKPLHDDDWFAPNALQTFAEVARAHPTAAFLTSGTNMLWEGGIKYRHGSQVSVYSSQACLLDLYLVGRTRALGIIPSSLLINSRLIRAGCLMRTYKSITWGVDQLFFVDLARHGEMVTIDDGLIFYDGTDHPSVTASQSFPAVDRETLDLKEYTWSLIANKAGVPDPEAVVRALRVARLRSRFRHQSWGATIRDALQLLRPTVVAAARRAVEVRRRGGRAAGHAARLPASDGGPAVQSGGS